MLQTIATPGSLPEVHATLPGYGARKIAGGTAVMPVLNWGTDDFTSLVSLRNAGFPGSASKDGMVTIGAATTLSELEDAPSLAFLKSRSTPSPHRPSATWRLSAAIFLSSSLMATWPPA